jgi:phosphatidylglycerophosphate synthase
MDVEKTGSQRASPARRPLASRGSGWARRATELALKTSITPNQISILSVVFAALGGAAIWAGPGAPFWFWLAAAAIQLRLVCNLLDGMVAIEGGRASPVGGIYNEAPDRIADALLIVPLGYAVSAPWLGWAGALAAVATAYVRALGGALGLKQDFRGPMAKQQRMAVLTGACLLAPLEAWTFGSGWSLAAAGWAIFIGSLLTCALRLRAIAAQLRARDA